MLWLVAAQRASLLNKHMDGTLYTKCIFQGPKVQYSLLTWHFKRGFSAMRKRMPLADSDKAIKDVASGFGERLAGLRKAAGFTQVGLAAKLGISQRMVAYYESPTATPPANLLPQIAATLGVTIDELFGIAQRDQSRQDGDNRLRQRLLAIKELDVADQRQVIELLDAFIERGQLKRNVENRL